MSSLLYVCFYPIPDVKCISWDLILQTLSDLIGLGRLPSAKAAIQLIHCDAKQQAQIGGSTQ
jgi:hypothetical protein